ncbi:MAG: hypothetical protein SGARI_002333 [Bacillariaceae sp.]
MQLRTLSMKSLELARWTPTIRNPLALCGATLAFRPCAGSSCEYLRNCNAYDTHDAVERKSNSQCHILSLSVHKSFLCVAWGVEWTGRIAYFTMGLPIVLLFVFLGKALTLPGASDGIEAYIGIWDMSVLTEQGEVWSVAASQIFFSIGLTFGILTAFGSHCKRDEPAVLNSCVIAGSNSMFSFISGFAVFAALGHLASLEGVAVTDLPYAGFGLVFGTWPVVFNTLPGGIHWVRLILFNLFLLGIVRVFVGRL